MITLYLEPEQLAWIAEEFILSDAKTKISIDPNADFEQQLSDLGAFDDFVEEDAE